jgi:outer membrane protein OmpA-like peptidoglycan-associated protein
MKSRFRQLLHDILPGASRERADEERTSYTPEQDPPRAVEPRWGQAEPPVGERAGPGVLYGAIASGAALLIALGVVGSAVKSAERRLAVRGLGAPAVATAQEAEVAYCTPDFKTVLERVLHSCGLGTATERRGCQPADIKTFAAINDSDFNALFTPLEKRGGVVLFDEGSDVLDEDGQKLLEERWFARQGARYFFVVARASKTGTPDQNRALSHRRANSVLFYLQKISGESEEELNQRVGLLWLGNEYAQLSGDYCEWPRSREQAPCAEEAINRSAFVSWVDCRL